MVDQRYDDQNLLLDEERLPKRILSWIPPPENHF